MTEEEKFNDEIIRDLFRSSDTMEVPAGLNERIMEEVCKIKPEKKSSTGFIRPAWILLFAAVVLLPFFLKLIPDTIKKLSPEDSSLFDLSANNLNFVFMVILAGALLLIAEQLMKLSLHSN